MIISKRFLEPLWLQRFWILIGKRILDIIISLFGIILCIPLWIVAGIFIKKESMGPMFYCQYRLGKNNRPFCMLKLRTMIDNAEKETGPIWSYEQDNRITQIGRIIRRWHLDETPQFVNVLIGDMSIIGPRPERREIIRKIRNEIPNYDERFKIKPGITGLSQIKQSYDSCVRDVQRKIRYDLFYIKKLCAFLDIKILFLTIIWVIQHRDW